MSCLVMLNVFSITLEQTRLGHDYNMPTLHGPPAPLLTHARGSLMDGPDAFAPANIPLSVLLSFERINSSCSQLGKSERVNARRCGTTPGPRFLESLHTLESPI
jgi:hypothetical protein